MNRLCCAMQTPPREDYFMAYIERTVHACLSPPASKSGGTEEASLESLAAEIVVLRSELAAARAAAPASVTEPVASSAPAAVASEVLRLERNRAALAEAEAARLAAALERAETTCSDLRRRLDEAREAASSPAGSASAAGAASLTPRWAAWPARSAPSPTTTQPAAGAGASSNGGGAKHSLQLSPAEHGFERPERGLSPHAAWRRAGRAGTPPAASLPPPSRANVGVQTESVSWRGGGDGGGEAEGGGGCDGDLLGLGLSVADAAAVRRHAGALRRAARLVPRPAGAATAAGAPADEVTAEAQ